jgi:hypothetical protein
MDHSDPDHIIAADNHCGFIQVRLRFPRDHALGFPTHYRRSSYSSSQSD